MRDTPYNLFWSLLLIAFMFVVTVGILWGVAKYILYLQRVGDDPWRAVIPRFYSSVWWYSKAHGGLSPFDVLKLIVISLALYFLFVACGNKIFDFAFPKSELAKNGDRAVEKLAKLTPKAVRCNQTAPDTLEFWHSPEAPLSAEWWNEAEGKLELAIGIAFRNITLRRRDHLVIVKFDYGDASKKADILVDDGTGGYHVFRPNGNNYVYIVGDNPNVDKCTRFKIGYVDESENLDSRLSEAYRWDSDIQFPLVIFPVTSQKEETAIKDRFDYLKLKHLNDGKHRGNEVFRCNDDLLAFVKEKISERLS